LTILYRFYKENVLSGAAQFAAGTRFDCYRCSVTSKNCLWITTSYYSWTWFVWQDYTNFITCVQSDWM